MRRSRLAFACSRPGLNEMNDCTCERSCYKCITDDWVQVSLHTHYAPHG
jgi:hypothetical protein